MWKSGNAKNGGDGLPTIDGQTAPWSPEYITEKTLEVLSKSYIDGTATTLDVLGYTKGLSNLTTLISIANDSYLYVYKGNMNDIAYGKTNDMVYGYRLVTTGLAWGAGYFWGGPIGFTVGAYTKGIEKAAVEGTKMEYQLRNYLNPSKKGNFWSQFYW